VPTDPREPPSPSPEGFRHLPTQATWSDLVLPAPELQQLHEIVERVSQQLRPRTSAEVPWHLRHAHGTSALFIGESGTGKTLAAEVLANALGLELLRIDFMAVVSKYIDETENNLARVFDAAEARGAILLFDEADALFGKRSEVKDSHDRYANLDIAYLLQRLEHHAGLLILTTNLPSRLDPAFLRRLRYVVDFPPPTP
jgi:SpoVK/Ycf46/Vps4 family AAA+-type ATPase